MKSRTLRITVAVLAAIALLGGAAIASADGPDERTDVSQWMHDHVGDHVPGEHHSPGEYHSGYHGPGEYHSGYHGPGEHHSGYYESSEYCRERP